MVKVQNLLKKSINIATSTLLLVSALLPASTLIFASNSVKAAVIPSNGILIPGGSADTGDHNYSNLPISTLHSMGTWIPLGTTKENVPGPNWFGMTTNGTNQAGYAIFRGAMDASQTFTISGYFRTASGGANYKDSGDSNGFILTPDSTSQISANASKYTGNSNTSKPVIYPTGPGLGIGGLNGSIFAGRDLYYNSPGSGLAADSGNSAIDGIYDGPFSGTGVSGASPAISIRTTRNASGASIISGDSTIGAAGELIYGKGSTTTTGVGANLGYPNATGPDTSYYTFLGNNSTQDDIMTLTWTNPVVASDGKSYTGTLSLKVQGMTSDGTASGNPVTISQSSITIPKTISIGTIGATGGNYGNLAFSNNSSSVTGNRGQKDVKVNYINAVTGKKILSCEPTSIKSNVGDIINVLSPLSQPSSVVGIPGKYEFVAPNDSTYSSLKGYSFNKVTYGGKYDDASGVLLGDNTTDPNGLAGSNKGITVSNYDGITNPNQINVYYTPKKETASFQTCYIGGTPGTSVVHTDEVNNIDFALPNSAPTTLGYASPLPAYESTSGYIDTVAPKPNGSGIPIGYNILQVIAPNEKVYTTENAINKGYASALEYALSENLLTDSNSTSTTIPLNTFIIMLSPDKHSATWQYKYDTTTPGYNGNDGTINLPSLPTISEQQGTTGMSIEDPGVPDLPPGYKVSQISNTAGTILESDKDLIIPNNFIKKYFPYIFMNVATYNGTTMNTPTFGTESSFTLLVSATQQTGKVTFKYNSGTPGTDKQGNPVVDGEGTPMPVTDSFKGTLGIVSKLPEPISLKGLTGERVSLDLDQSIPKGYAIDSVATPDGTKYTDNPTSGKTALQEALAANPYFEDDSESTNQFTVYLKALPDKSASVSIKMDKSEIPEGSTIPEEQSFIINKGLVGAPISEGDIQSAVDTLTSGGGVFDTTSSTYNNWYITSLTGPQNSTISTASEMNNKIAAEKLAELIALNPYFLTDNNSYVIHMSYAGMLSLRVPSTIDFGSHDISGQSTNVKGNMDSSVSIIDSRTSPTSWTLEVQQSSQLTGYVKNTGLIIPNLGLIGGLTFLDKDGNNTLLSNNASAIVYHQDTGTNDVVEAMSNNTESKACFYLDVPSNEQVSKWYGDDVIYKGEVLWILSNTP